MKLIVSRAVATAFALNALVTIISTDAATHVDVAVHRALRRQGGANIMVTMKQGTQEALNNVQESTTTSRGEKITQLVESLEAHATESQQEVLQMLSQESTEPLYASKKSFWITNQLYFEAATPELVDRLSRLESVAEISPASALPLPRTEPERMTHTNSTVRDTAEWGVKIIKAPEVWAKGFDGKGIIVGGIDTGVFGTHEALASNFRGEYGWYDPVGNSTRPTDTNGHGSHTMGTIAGSHGVGVAPGATWMACRGCGEDGCYPQDLLSCMQFMTCPTDPQGKNRDCSKAPHVVNNSWGGGQGSQKYDKAVEAWLKAGIIPIFSIGNEGPMCGTASSPGDSDRVISVGATTSTDGIASLSSKGPAVNGLMKPELSAPGAKVRSVSTQGVSEYILDSGTSMAAPHVAGAVALILQAKPNIKFDQMKDLLVKTVDTKSLAPSDKKCGKDNGGFPNNSYGYGRLNVLNAVNA